MSERPAPERAAHAAELGRRAPDDADRGRNAGLDVVVIREVER